jgi:hypothetical protein
MYKVFITSALLLIFCSIAKSQATYILSRNQGVSLSYSIRPTGRSVICNWNGRNPRYKSMNGVTLYEYELFATISNDSGKDIIFLGHSTINLASDDTDGWEAGCVGVSDPHAALFAFGSIPFKNGSSKTGIVKGWNARPAKLGPWILANWKFVIQ